jgi:hypothetical protein
MKYEIAQAYRYLRLHTLAGWIIGIITGIAVDRLISLLG